MVSYFDSQGCLPQFFTSMKKHVETIVLKKRSPKLQLNLKD